MNSLKTVWMALIAVAIIAIGGYFYPHAIANIFGGITNYDEVDASAIRIGSGCNNSGNSCAGTRLGGVYAGACSLIAASYTVAASTTVSMDCAVPNLVSGDGIEPMFATSTAPGNGWVISGASASTTSGFATFRVTNWTGASNVIPASIASSTIYEAFHLLSSAPGI